MDTSSSITCHVTKYSSFQDGSMNMTVDSIYSNNLRSLTDLKPTEFWQEVDRRRFENEVDWQVTSNESSNFLFHHSSWRICTSPTMSVRFGHCSISHLQHGPLMIVAQAYKQMNNLTCSLNYLFYCKTDTCYWYCTLMNSSRHISDFYMAPLWWSNRDLQLINAVPLEASKAKGDEFLCPKCNPNSKSWDNA